MQGFAQDFRTPWIFCPTAGPGEQVWFREVVELDEKPAQVWLSVATTGYTEVFINERNISTDVRLPYREADDDEDPLALQYNVTRFFGPGRNVVAIHYSPALHSDLHQQQIAASLWGFYRNGYTFALQTDDEWLCRPAATRLNGHGGEFHDSRLTLTKWNSTDIDAALWQQAEPCPSAVDVNGYEEPYGLSPAEHVTGILRPDFYKSIDNGFLYHFEEAFMGWVRLTLRHCVPGQRIVVDGMEYVCNGLFDEQACLRFSIEPHRDVIISSDRELLPEQIFSVEGLEVSPFPSAYFWP